MSRWDREAKVATSDLEAMVAKILTIKETNPDNTMAAVFSVSYYNSIDEQLKPRFLKCLNSGIENPDSTVGCYACQPDDYDVFKPFFTKVLERYHKVDLTATKHINNWSLASVKGLPSNGVLDLSDLGLPSLSVRVRTARNLNRFPLPGSMMRQDRIDMEKAMGKVFDQLISMPKYGGRYVSITPGHSNFISQMEYQALVDAHIMFKNMAADKYLMAAGIASDWPYGRGCYISKDKGFIIWVGEEDHLRVMCMGRVTILNDVFDRLKVAIDIVEDLIEGGCAKSDCFGVVTSCPTNIGTGMRASVHIQLPNLTADGTDTKAKAICKPLGLSVRGLGGEHTPIGTDGTVDISPSARFCISEAEIIAALYKGVEMLKREEDTEGKIALAASLPPSVGCDVENRLRHATQRIRVSEFFKDYDPLRTGFITRTQFRRCLDQHLGLRLSESDYEFLADKYDQKKSGRINYRAFSSGLENAFDPNILDGNPSAQIEAFQSTVPASPTLPPETLFLADQVLKKCQEYYRYHGISVKSCYRDFDKHHRGFVTDSQFHRSLPGPPDLTPAEVSALAQRYRDPSSGLYNYMQFHSDIGSLGREGSGGVKGAPQPPSVPKQLTASLEEIFQKIRVVVYKNGIRTTEFFRDHDKLRSGIITENQFICGLSLCCGQLAHLSRDEIQRIVEHYRTPDGRVRYKEFCDLMENTYNVPELEKKPMASVYRPLRGHLARPLNSLGSEDKEGQVDGILGRLKREVKQRRLLLYPYFRDYDRGKGYTRGVTKPQFERLLNFFSLKVTPDERKLIVSKFEDPNGGDVNYVAFIQAIDEEYTGQVMEMERESPPDPSPRSPHHPPEEVDVGELVARIQEHVCTNRIRVSEHFQDFDPLRSGSISAARFRQGLSSLGLPYLTDAQFTALCNHYANPSQKGCVSWKRFLDDVDQVFTASDLGGTLPRLGAVDFSSTASPGEKEMLETVMFRLRERVNQRRVLAKPCFQDFDKHNMGYVTHSQFRQCLSYLGLGASEEERRVVEVRFSDSKGFNYLQFLEELQPSEKLEDKYRLRMTQLTAMKQQAAARRSPPVTVSADQVLDKIKTKVSKERVRVLEFMRDYDKLRSGRIPVTSFRRALDLCRFPLSQEEVTVLEERYLSAKDPTCVDYMRFSDDVESIFTHKDLEKTPTAEVQQFVPPMEVGTDVLSPEEEQILQKTMHRLAERVRVRRIQIFPLFEDYDRVHIGSVTRSQFHRVLSELEMGGLVNALEFGILYRKFDVKVGGRNDVNYIAFCEMIDDYAQTMWSDPALK